MSDGDNEPRKGRTRSDDYTKAGRRRLSRRERRNRREREGNLKLENFGKIHWSAYTHRRLWDMIKSAQPPVMGEKAYQWAELAKGVDSATAEVNKITQRLMLSWRGQSAVQAASSVSALTEWGAEASQTVRTIGDRLDTYTSAVEVAQHRMPEPVHPKSEQWFKEGYDVNILAGPNGAYMLDQLLDDHQPTVREQRRAKAEAVQVMDDYESVSKDVHDGLPQFRGAPQVTDVQPESTHVAGPSGDVPMGGTGYYDDDVPYGRSTGDSSSYGSTTTSSASGAAGFPGGAGMPGAGGTPGFPGGGVGGPFGGPGGPGGQFGAGGPLGPGPYSGSGSAGSAAARAVYGLGAPRGGGFGPGFGMFPPPAGAHGARDDEREHRNKYGKGLDLMDDMPPAYPPVFGDD